VPFGPADTPEGVPNGVSVPARTRGRARRRDTGRPAHVPQLRLAEIVEPLRLVAAIQTPVRAGGTLWHSARFRWAGTVAEDGVALSLGVVGYTMHQLRHAAADDLRRATGSTVAAQQLLRHKSIATTEAYLHADVDDLRRVIEQLSSSGAHGMDDSSSNLT
jgi:integrase